MLFFLSYRKQYLHRVKNRWSNVSAHPVNRVSASQSHIKSCGGDGHIVWTQTLPDLVCRKINTFLWLSKIIAGVKVPLKASDWPSIACGSWLDCVFREGGREWNAAEREGIRAERLPSAEAELIEREGGQRASQNTKCLNCNTLENSRAPKNRRASPFLNCSCTGKSAYQRRRVKSWLHYSQKVCHGMEDSVRALTKSECE